ncbi:MAG: HEAT repeat domain-containing protein [Myxococcales bacterium]|nr:HEAT repeat domain-containing protein [Myxococcales bacterium]
MTFPVVEKLTVVAVLGMGVWIATPARAFDWDGGRADFEARFAAATTGRARVAVLLHPKSASAEAQAPTLRRIVDTDGQPEEVRRAAVERAAALQLPWVTAILLDWSTDSMPERRRAAIEGLGRMPSPEAEARILRALSDSDAQVRLAAAEALSNMASEANTAAIQARLSDSNEDVRAALVRALGNVADPRATTAVLGATLDSAVAVRVAAMRAVGVSNDPRAEAAAIRGLRDADPSVRREALRALEGHPSEVALDALSAYSRSAETHEAELAVAMLLDAHDPLARDRAVALLEDSRLADIVARTIVARHAVPVGLASALERWATAGPPQALTDPTVTVLAWLGEKAPLTPFAPTLEATLTNRVNAGEQEPEGFFTAFGATADARALPALLSAARNENVARARSALRGLALYTRYARPDGRLVEPLRDAFLAAPNEAIRAEVVGLIGAQHAARSVGFLLECVRTGGPEVRRAALDALVGFPGVLPRNDAVIEGIGDSHGDVRASTSSLLGTRGDEYAIRHVLRALLEPAPHDRATLIETLGRRLTDRRRDVPALSRALRLEIRSAVRSFLVHDDPRLRARAFEVVRRSADVGAVPALLHGIGRLPARERTAWVAGLGELPSPSTRRALRRIAAEERDPDTRAAALLALGECGEDHDRDAIRPALDDRRWPVADAARAALHRLSQGAAVDSHRTTAVTIWDSMLDAPLRHTWVTVVDPSGSARLVPTDANGRVLLGADEHGARIERAGLPLESPSGLGTRD